ncbi:MAG: hypothetical protein OEV92_08605 [Nitrospinota bacterium]|nr:hypothetical protein [Nitrospinota bacterium]
MSGEASKDSRQPPFVGRGTDMAMLRQRIENPGVTVLTGRPQIGKSTLLQHLRDENRANKDWLVGYHMVSVTDSALLYAAADLYKHAFKDSTWLGQLKILYNERGPGLPARVGKAIGAIIAEAAPHNSVKEAITQVFGALEQAEETLRTGGGRTALVPPTLDEVRELLGLAQMAGKERRLLLIIDQWEDGRDLEHETALLRSFVNAMSDWPETLHVILHLRHPEDDTNNPNVSKAFNAVRNLERASSSVQRYELDRIKFEEDKAARKTLMEWLRCRFPFVSSEPEIKIFGMIDGNPGVLRRWLDGRPKDIDVMDQLAQKSHLYQYPELRNEIFRLLVQKKVDDRRGAALYVALRLVLLPVQENEQVWIALQPCFMQGAPDSMLDDFRSCGFLDRNCLVPSLGHPKRREAAFNLAVTEDELRPHTRRALETLIDSLAEKFESLKDLKIALFSEAISTLEHSATMLEAAGHRIAMTLATKTLLGQKVSPAQMLKFLAEDRQPLNSQKVMIISAGLFNAIIYAKENDDLLHRDALLDELLKLQRKYPEDAAVRELLAKGLLNAINHTKREKDLLSRDALLDELRKLNNDHPEDTAVRERLAKSLVNTIIDAEDEDDPERRDTLAKELRELFLKYPDDNALKEIISKMNEAGSA